MLMTGRRKIYVEPVEYTSSNILDTWANIQSVMRENADDIDYLHRYLLGDQPILDRIKEVRPEICNRTVENHALEIQNFKVGFTVGEPIQYVLHGVCEEHDPDGQGDTRVAKLNELMVADSKAAKDKRLADWIFQCGVGYRMCLPTKNATDFPFETFILDPRRAFVAVSDDYREEPLLCGYTSSDGSKVSIYSRDHFWVIEDNEIVKSEVNALGALPVIQYKNNEQMQGCFEPVLDLCDALNTAQANRLDGVEQFIQSFVWFHNCDIDTDEFEKLKANGGIRTKSAPGVQAMIQIISESLDQTQTQTLVEDLYQRLLTIAGVPDRKASAGGNTGQALVIGEGWVLAESMAKDFEREFSEPEKEFLDIVLKICRNTRNAPEDVGSLSVSDIDVKFTRNRTDNLLTKTQALMNMLDAGVAPREAFKRCDLFPDPEQAYQDSIPTLEAKKNSGETTVESDIVETEPVGQQILNIMQGLTENGAV